MAAAVYPALLPRQETHYGEAEASPAVREHRQKTHRSAATPGKTAAVWERLTPASLTYSPAPGEREDEARQGRAGGRRV